MSLPEIGAVVKNVLVSRSPEGSDVIQFEDGTEVEVPKSREGPVRMVRDTERRGILEQIYTKTDIDWSSPPNGSKWNDAVWKDHGGK